MEEIAELAIVIPAYKDAFLRKALASIASQTEKNFHVYVGDDCSPDAIGEIVEEFSDKIPITYHRFDFNLGAENLVGQWQRCIDLTQGEPFIWLFSDDDEMGQNCVERFLSIPREVRESSVIHFNINIIDSNDNVIKTPHFFPEHLSAAEYLRLKLTGHIISYVIEFIFPRKIYNECNGFANFDLAWGSDFITWLNMATIAPGGILTPEGPMINWRTSDINISPRKDRKTLIRKIRSLIENAEFIKSLMANHPDKFKGMAGKFRWIRFPLGEIRRNEKNLGLFNSLRLAFEYFRKILV